MTDEVAIQLKRIADLGWAWFHKIYGVAKEKPLTPVRHNEYRTNAMDIQQFSFNLAERTDDVVKREVVLTIAENVAVPDGFPRVQTRSVEGAGAASTGTDLSEGRDIAIDGAFEAPEGATCSLSVVAIDNAGNKSLPLEQEFIATDEIAPVAEGQAEAVRLGERQV
jgi:hypothetical protein